MAKRKQSLYLPQEMIDEARAEAQRLDRSLSWVLQRAWRIAKREIKELPGEEPYTPTDPTE